MGNPAKGWTPERRKRQSEAIQRWKPWQQSTGPQSAKGKAAASRNAWSGGHTAKLRQIVKELNQAMRGQRGWRGKSVATLNRINEATADL